MSGYSVSFNRINTPTTITYAMNVAIRAGQFSVRLVMIEARVQFSATATITPGYVINRYESSTMSGGSGLTPIPVREGAGPASATALYQPLVNSVGTNTYTPGSAVTISGTPRLLKREVTGSDLKQWQPPLETVLAPGSILNLLPGENSSGYAFMDYLTVWLDEEHVVRSR